MRGPKFRFLELTLNDELYDNWGYAAATGLYFPTPALEFWLVGAIGMLRSRLICGEVPQSHRANSWLSCSARLIGFSSVQTS